MRWPITILAGCVACGEVRIDEPASDPPREIPADGCPGEPTEPWFHLLGEEMISTLPTVHWGPGGRSYLVGEGSLELPRNRAPEGEGDGFVAALDPCGTIQWERRLPIRADMELGVRGSVTASGAFAFLRSVDDGEPAYNPGPRTARYGLLGAEGEILFERDLHGAYQQGYASRSLAMATAGDATVVGYRCPDDATDPDCPAKRVAVRVQRETGEPLWTQWLGFDNIVVGGAPFGAFVDTIAMHPSGAVTVVVAALATGQFVVGGAKYGQTETAIVRFDADGNMVAHTFASGQVDWLVAAGESAWYLERWTASAGLGDGTLVQVDEQLTPVASQPVDYGASELGALYVTAMSSTAARDLYLAGQVADGRGGLRVDGDFANGPFLLKLRADASVERLLPISAYRLDRREDGAWIGAGIVGEAPFDYPGHAGEVFIGRGYAW